MTIRRIKAKVVLALLATCHLSPLCAQRQPAAGFDADYARAEAMVRDHQWDAGIDLLTSLLASDPHNVKALNLTGIAFAAKGDPQRANQYFDQSLKVDPHFLPALKNLSINEFNAHQYASAEQHLLVAQRQLPNDPTVNLYLGEIAFRQQKFKLAADRLDRAKDVVLRNPNVSADFAVSLLRSGKKQQAQEVLENNSASSIDPDSQLALGVALAEAGLDTQAIPYLQAAFQHDPDSYDTGFDLTLAGVEAKDYATAIAASKELIDRNHDTSELENLLAEALGATGATHDAIAAYKKAIALDPNDENNYLDFTSLCIDHRSFEDGMKVVSLGLQIHPKSERLMFIRGILHAEEDNFELAEADFREAALLSPQRDYGSVGLGAMYLNRGDPQQALRIIRDRLRQKPNDASLQYLLGESLIQSGAFPGQTTYAEAQVALEKSVKLNPSLCLPHISLGSIFLDENRFSDAATQFEQARAIDPQENSAYSHLAVAYRRLGQPEKAMEVLTELKQILEQGRTGARVKVETRAEDPSR